MADISVIVDYSSVKAANIEIEKTGSSAQKSAKVFEAAFKSAEIQAKKNLKTVRDQINFSKRMEAQKVKEAKASAQAARNQANEEERLRSKFVAGHSAMNIYSRELDELARARKLDIISAQQQSAAVESLNSDFKAGTGIFANYANAMGKSSNRMGVAMQQTGYQVGDFLVQVQSGTNPMVAFGQQATQLVGVMYLLPQATLAAKVGIMGLKLSMGAIVAVVSILIPLATAIGAYFLRAGEDAKEASAGVNTYADAIDNLNNKLKGLVETRLSETTQFDADLLVASEKRLQLANKIAEKEIESSGYTGDKKRFVDALIQTLQDELAAETAKIDLIVSRIRQEEAATKKREAAAKWEEGSAERIANRLSQRNDFMEYYNKLQDDLKKKQDAFNTAGTKTDELRIKLAFRRQKLLDALSDRQRKSDKTERDALEEANRSAEDKLQGIVDQNRLLKIQATLGKESLTYKIAEKEIAQDRLVEELKLAGVSQDIIDKIIAQDSRQRNLTQEISDSADEAERIAKAFDDAKTAASKIKPNFAGVLDPRGESGSVTEAMRRGYQFPSTTDKPSTKSTKEPAVKETDLSKLQKQLDLEDALFGKTEARQRVIQALGVDFVKNNPKTVAGLEEQINKNLELVRVEQQRIDLANTIGSAMEDSLMSMVDGTKSVKDAFRDMAADIVRHLYKVLVVQRAINAIGGIMSGSSNPVMQTIGGRLESYGSADGGGYTGNGPRSGGLDGKGGFMMMMHPRETVIDHTKGQQANTNGPTIVQNFNFSANGDDSVKKIIAQAAPQIAQMTKKSMLDDRRRGGTTKAVFG
jgi:hypothetical protein